MLHQCMPLEVKLAGGEGQTGMKFEGYGAYFNNTDAYGDVIAPGAFKRTLREARKSGQWPAMLLQHGNWLGGDDNMPVGVWTGMEEDEKGLRVEGELADTQRGKDAYTLLKMKPRPAITGLSIGFIAKKFTLRTKPDDPRRTLEDIELMEVSLVTFPANPKARVTGVKALDARGLEEALRSELKLSQRDAVSAIALMKKHLREEDDDDQVGREGPDPDKVAELLRRNIETLRG
jgi:hypothetical protein